MSKKYKRNKINKKERDILFKVKDIYYIKYYRNPKARIVDATFAEDSGIFLKAKDVKNWNHVRPYDQNWNIK